MRLHYMGSYNLDPASLPRRPHRPGAKPFKEVQDTKALSLIANGICVVTIILLGSLIFLRYREDLKVFSQSRFQLILGCLLPMICLYPHELLHALCFKEDVYVYSNLKQGMLFVVGPEDMSRGRVIFMSLLPNILFGFIPYVIGMLWPELIFFAAFGTISTGMGGGDYYNVFNTLLQTPKNALVYMHGLQSYWYVP